MNMQTLDGLVKTANVEWKPLFESGVDTRGISVKPLRTEPATGRAPSFLLRFEPGAKYPYHRHSASGAPTGGVDPAGQDLKLAEIEIATVASSVIGGREDPR